MRKALLDLVPDTPIHVELRALLLDHATVLRGDERGALVWEAAASTGGVIGAPSARLLADAPLGYTWLARRPWPGLSASWRSASVAIRPSDASTLEADASVRALDPVDLARVDAMLVPELERAFARGSLVLGIESGESVVSVAYSPWQSETHADLSVDTRLEHRRRGLAARVVGTLVRRLADDGRTAVWGATDDNRASLALSERLSFVPIGMLWVSEPELG